MARVMTVNRLGLAAGELQDLAFIRTLAYAGYGAASAGEVTYVARRIAEAGGGREAYARAWVEQGRANAARAREALAAGRTATVRTWDGVHRQALVSGRALAATIENSMLWTTGAASLGEFLRLTRAFRLTDLVERITVPVLSLSADGESAVQRAQAASFHERLDVPHKRFHRLTVADGADAHCGIGNIALTSSIVYDWLAGVLAG